MKISIIWWTGGFGLWLWKYISKHFENIEILISGIDHDLGQKLANENNFSYFENQECASKWDIVIFAVPISQMESVIESCAPLVQKQAIIADICSIKWFPSKLLQKFAPKWTLIVPTHPMFGPYVDDVSGQIVVITPLQDVQDNAQYLFFRKILKEKWVKIIESTPEYHDKMMAVVQWLTHINMFTIGESIKRLGVDVLDSLNFVSPIYKMMIASVARYVGHDANLYADIQMYNDQVKSVHRIFMETLKDFNVCVESSDREWFLNIVEGTQTYFGSQTEFWQHYTDKIIYLMWTEQSQIRENIWKNQSFKNFYTWKITSWIVQKIDWNCVIFENWESLDLDKNVLL